MVKFGLIRYGLTAAVLGVAVAVTGCSTGMDEVNAGQVAGTPTTTSAPVPTAPGSTPGGDQGSTPVGNGGSGHTGSGGPGSGGHGGTKPSARCTDRINYAGDPRSNAEINSIGERTGTCPPVQKPGTPPGDADKSCTDKINYAGDPRSNAEINSIGETTGHCPAPQR